MCNNAGLEAVPSDLPQLTRQLSLSNNRIRRIGFAQFRNLTYLRRLILDNNLISEVAPDAFLGLGDLEVLSLQNNPLTVLSSRAFSGIYRVRSLYLGYNRVAAVEADAFSDSGNIKTLSLQGNPIKVLHSFAFQGLHNVELLHLPYKIQTIEPNAFNGLTNVSLLRLEVLDIDELLTDTFRGLTSVSTLIIIKSRIGYLRTRTFQGLSNTKLISLEDNNIDTTDRAVFAGSRNIEKLRIINNKFFNLRPGVLDGLLPETSTSVNVSGNLVPCDCRLRWMADHALVVPTIMRDNRCRSPPQHEGKTLNSIPLEGIPTCLPEEFPIGLSKDKGNDVDRLISNCKVVISFIIAILGFLAYF
ncbi:slit homolog 1 protein-like [Limulus polyphemus]|uniref:Slit homolog 1 protein-like n=1 Tax=Limulus polyphemus TaxID=6850 RepID=A0ABM1BNT8_LIMPO|nr:slit homolog 1 protein-like [Limulus polyphemus]